jgi:hypothetical protein
MIILIHGIICALAGLTLNQTMEEPTHAIFDKKDTEHYPRNNLTRLVQYVEGSTLIILLYAGVIVLDKSIPAAVKVKILAALILTYFWCGGGVVIGNIWNEYRNLKAEGKL